MEFYKYELWFSKSIIWTYSAFALHRIICALHCTISIRIIFSTPEQMVKLHLSLCFVVAIFQAYKNAPVNQNGNCGGDMLSTLFIRWKNKMEISAKYWNISRSCKMKWTQIIFSLSHSSVYDSDCHLKPHNNDMVTAKRKKIWSYR